MLYFDTSALLPYYRQEIHSAAVEQLLMSQATPVLISDLTRLEFANALASWVRMGEIEEGHAQRISRAFEEDLTSGRYALRRNTPGQADQARQWLLARNTRLRTLDALHLACAASSDATLVSFDEALVAAALTLGIRIHRLP